jgi:Ca-activated chloride channel family protein
MSFKALRPFLATFLMAAFVVSLLPVAYAGQAGQSALRSAYLSTQSGSQGKTETQRRPTPPPFDRPPLVTDRRTQDSQPAGAQPSSAPPVLRRPPATDSRNPSSASTDRDSPGATSDIDSSGGRNDRSRGAPPVLHRPSDSREQSGQPPANSQDRRQNGGQQNGANQVPGDDEQIVKLESTLVNIPLLVSDRSGRYVPQLTKNDFLLYEDGTQQEIASFGSEEVPFNVALLLDVSPSVEGNIESIQDAALAFVRQLRPQDRVMVVSFDRMPRYLTDFTSDRRQLEWAIRSISTGSGTSVYDAVYETVSRRMRNIEGRKALLLFSDGEDTTSSQASYDDAINIVSESDVLVYGLRYPGAGGRGNIQINPWPRNPIPNIPMPLPWPWPFPRRRRGPFTLSESGAGGYATSAAAAGAQSRSRRRGMGGGGDFMADITSAGGGPVYDAERVGDLSRLANKIAEELRHVYVISYYPSNPLSNGGYRTVRVRVKNRDDIAVRHRRGYNARDVGNPKH